MTALFQTVGRFIRSECALRPDGRLTVRSRDRIVSTYGLPGWLERAARVEPRTWGNLPAITEDDLLDEAQLEELVSLDMLDQSFLKGIAQIRSQLAQLSVSAGACDLQSTHATLHLIPGISGNIGARALHAFVKQIYPRVLDGLWPLEADWLARMSTPGNQSADALQRYFVAATVSLDHRRVPGDE